MKMSIWRSMVAGGVLALVSGASHAVDLRFGANDAEGRVIVAVLDVEPINMQVTDTVLGDGTLLRRFVGQAEGMRSWLFDRSDGLVLAWGNLDAQELVVENSLRPDGGSQTVLNMTGIDKQYSHTRRIGTANLTYHCVCSDLFLSEGNELTAKAFARFDGVFGVAAIEQYNWEWVPDGEATGELAWVLKERQEIVFGAPPVPEPSIWAMGLAGVALVMFRRRQRASRLHGA